MSTPLHEFAGSAPVEMPDGLRDELLLLKDMLVHMLKDTARSDIPEIVITIRKVSEIEELLEQMAALEKKYEKLYQELRRMQVFGQEVFILQDKLHNARLLLRENGIDPRQID